MSYKRSRTKFEADQASPSYAIFGTPLPVEEDARDDGSFVPVWKQEVRDERGRKRLHGAFTGGFSAGWVSLLPYAASARSLLLVQLLQYCRIQGRLGTLDVRF